MWTSSRICGWKPRIPVNKPETLFQSRRVFTLNDRSYFRSKRIGIIGWGTLGKRLGQAIHEANIDNRWIIEATTKGDEDKITTDKFLPTIDNLYSSNRRLANRCSTIFIAVKPNQAREVSQEISSKIQSEDIILSVVAGVQLKHLNKWVPEGKKVKLMPNLPVEFQSGSMAAYSEDLHSEEMKRVEEYFPGTKFVWFDQEEKIDLATAISGCAPAYIGYLLQKMIFNGFSLSSLGNESRNNQLGLFHERFLGSDFEKMSDNRLTVTTKLTESETKNLLIPAFQGTAVMLNEYSLDEIINLTACKGGATEKAIRIFDHQQISKIIELVQSSALARIQEISKELDNL